MGVANWNKCRLLFFFLILIVVPFMGSCKKEESVACQKSIPMADVNQVNSTIGSIHGFVIQSNRDGRIVAFDIHDNSYDLIFDDGVSITIPNQEMLQSVGCPNVTVIKHDGTLCWCVTVETKSLLFPIKEGMRAPHFFLENNTWKCSFGNSLKEVSVDNITRNIFSGLELFTDDCRALLCFPTGATSSVKWSEKVYIVKRNEPNHSFYKDIFLDAGYGLTSRQNLSAISYCGLSMEHINFNDSAQVLLQNQIVGGYEEDANGRLLYPDGQPRYKAIFVIGGNAYTHGTSLSTNARDNLRMFYFQGGSYVGTCAGVFFASSGSTAVPNCPYYLGLWPQNVANTRVKNSSVSFRITSDSPLCRYVCSLGDSIIPNVRHNGGCYPSDMVEGAEVLAYIDSSISSTFMGKPAIWAYKTSLNSGRMVLTGSHPEGNSTGVLRDLTAAMIRYAIDGRGNAKIKGFLKNGEWRVMDQPTEAEAPDYAKIGDLQYHYFVVYIPQSAVNIKFSLTGTSSCDMQLLLSQSGLPYDNNADYVVSEPGSNQELQFLTLSPGIWYVGVKCNTTVVATTSYWGQTYSGHLETLNGVPYRIKASWENISAQE